jgi:hypothetical protein
MTYFIGSPSVSDGRSVARVERRSGSADVYILGLAFFRPGAFRTYFVRNGV